jgi:hypothetical protein
VAVSERTHRILWAKASGRCSICRVQVAGDRADADDPSVFGEEAHIVGRSPGGPRAGDYAGDIDGYDNLMLLCSKCHKQVDDQVNTYTVERLREIKAEHEAWAAKLGERPDPGPTRLIPDPAHPTPKMLKLFTSGSVFWHFFAGSCSFSPCWPEGLGDENEDLIAAFLQDLKDWMDAVGMEGDYSDHREASKAMDHHISELAKAGFLLGAKRRYMLLTGGVDAAPVPWRLTEIEIQPASLALLMDENGNPIRPHGDA